VSKASRAFLSSRKTPTAFSYIRKNRLDDKSKKIDHS